MRLSMMKQGTRLSAAGREWLCVDSLATLVEAVPWADSGHVRSMARCKYITPGLQVHGRLRHGARPRTTQLWLLPHQTELLKP